MMFIVNVFLILFLTSAAAAKLENICIKAIKFSKKSHVKGIVYQYSVCDSMVYYRK